MSNATQIIGDSRFTEGFRLMNVVPIPNVATRGHLFSGDAASPWRLCEWNTAWPIDPEDALKGRGWQLCRNEAKTVGVASSTEAGGDLLLQVSTLPEYNHTLRTAETPWVHLLVEQKLPKPAPLLGLESARLCGRVRLLHCREPDVLQDPGRHAAQFFLYFTISNHNKTSLGFSDYYWLGIPFFDSRAESIPDYRAKDFGGTNKYIYTPGTGTWGLGTLRDLGWMAFDVELKPGLLAGLNAAWNAGYLPASHHMEDYAMTAVNMGWEMPGTFDAAMQVERLACWVDRR